MQKQGVLQAERRQFEERINRLESELQEANLALQTNASSAKEKESTISEFKMRLAGVSKTKDVINECLTEASGSIKAALALQVTSSEPETDAKASREKVLNQLLLMLNTAVGEKKKDEANVVISDQLDIPRNEEENIDYLHGSLGLVPN